MQVIGATPNLWRLDVSSADLASRCWRLPASIDLVALHSNPGPVHTFVRPDSLDLAGLIDFGDAYISHPALDWRWPTHADRVALLHGYCNDTPATDEFMAAWHAVLVLSDVGAGDMTGDEAPGTGADLRDLLSTLA